jgi:16S rRNA (cytidine1402-2'-O)-methyltransferase
MMYGAARGLGKLYVVATPIGNRDDITLRALAVLKAVDFVLAEDTRHSSTLLHAFGISKPLIALHEHNEQQLREAMLRRVQQGESCALISDAGTPLISDPGYLLVSLARSLGIDVVPIPGPCALIAALCASGVPADSFTFIGFLPAKGDARRTRLAEFVTLKHALICYESTHRVLDCLSDVAQVYGPDCELVLAKEITKAFEGFIHGTPASITTWLQMEANRVKGEFVLIIPPKPVQVDDALDIEGMRVLAILCAQLPLKQAVKSAAEITGINRNKLYALALHMQKHD